MSKNCDKCSFWYAENSYSPAFCHGTDSDCPENDLMQYALDILERRAEDLDRDPSSRIAYCTAIDLIKYALAGNEECMRQFDYDS